MSRSQSKVITVRMSPEQFDYITKQSTQAGMSKNEYCLFCLIGETSNADSVIVIHEKLMEAVDEIVPFLEDQIWHLNDNPSLLLHNTRYVEVYNKFVHLLNVFTPKKYAEQTTFRPIERIINGEKGISVIHKETGYLEAYAEGGPFKPEASSTWANALINGAFASTSDLRDQPVPDSVPVENEGR